MRFKVPQDVQRADQIVGPLTWRQMFILGGGGGICYAIYVTLGKEYLITVWLPPVALVGGFTAALAFIKIHGLRFEIFLLSLLEYHLLPKKRIWHKGQAEPFVSFLQRKTEEKKKPKAKKSKKRTKSLKEMARILDTKTAKQDAVAEAAQVKLEKKKALQKLITHKQ